MNGVQGLAYVVVESEQFDHWRAFASDLLGLQVEEAEADHILFRADERCFRLRVRRGGAEAVTTLGWEVATAEALEEVGARVEKLGFQLDDLDGRGAPEGTVGGGVRFDDGSGVSLELIHGHRVDKTPFVSPTGARFVTGEGGLGHAFQAVVDDDLHRALYLDGLGFRLSDHIEFGNGRSATFLHCNPRHHSMAFGALGEPRVGHIMFEVDGVDTVGRAYDRVLDGAATVSSTLGRHSNDLMLSFYVNSPSAVQVEYGTDGLLIEDDATWTPVRYSMPSFWGHRRS